MPSVGVESAPADMLAWALVKHIRSEYSSGTRTIDSCIKEMKYASFPHSESYLSYHF
jgi:hypothetical protein